MFTERKSRSAEINITYSIPAGHGWHIDNWACLAGESGTPTLPCAETDVQSVDRVCAVCARPLTGRQERCCSLVCQRAFARRTPRPYRDQCGPKNPAWKGGVSRYPTRYTRAFKAANPEKVQAQRAVAHAIRSGTLKRPNHCSVCRRACRPDAHHFSYLLPLCVDWLCRKCHVAADRVRQQRELQAAATTLEQSKGHAHVVNQSSNLAHTSTVARVSPFQKSNSIAGKGVAR